MEKLQLNDELSFTKFSLLILKPVSAACRELSLEKNPLKFVLLSFAKKLL